MAFEYRRGGRRVSSRAFFEGLANDAIDSVMENYAKELHGKAASIVDPETGRHAPVFVRQIGREAWSIHTTGSPSFATRLENRLGLTKGEVRPLAQPSSSQRVVYLAHASEDKEIALPLAKGLIERGIDVWYDNWEIRAGDSLRRKMEAGLENCTHFLVLLSPNSIDKPWVAEEIDVGLLRAVEGTSKFIGLRSGISLKELSPFLQSRLAPSFDGSSSSLDDLAGDILEVSRKPALGKVPKFVKREAPEGWSNAATLVAEYFVSKSDHAGPMDPIASYEDIQDATELPMPDVRIGVLDLAGAGLLECTKSMSTSRIHPKPDLFVVFDATFMDWSPEEDAKKLGTFLHNLETRMASLEEIDKTLDWGPRRLNAAAAFLVAARVVGESNHIGGGKYWPCRLTLGDELLRFVRSI